MASNTNYFAMIDDDNDFEMWQGLRGPAGPAGQIGPRGPAGEAGPAGADGKSAYEAAQEGGYTGTESQFNAALAEIDTALHLDDVDDALSDTSENPVQNKVITAELSQQKSAIEALEDLTNRKAGMLVDTVSGSIASFVPDSTIPNLLGVSVAVEPVQDLHGYDSPWPAGGGVNKYPILIGADTFVDNAGATHSNDNGTLVINCVAQTNSGVYAFTQSQIRQLPAGYTGAICYSFSIKASTTATILAGYERFGYQNISATTSWQRVSITSTVDGNQSAFVVYNRSSSDVTVEVKDFQFETGSTAHDYAPYSNLCPISGWDAVGISSTSINIWDEQWEVGDLNQQGLPSTGSYVRTKNFIPILGGMEYYAVKPQINIYYFAYDNDKVVIPLSGTGYKTLDFNAHKFTPPAEAKYIKFVLGGSYGTTYNNDISINYPATDHDYHAYAGNTYTITIGQTVYGGTLDATNGTMTVDRKFEPLNNLTAYYGEAVSWVFDSGNNVFSTNKQVAPAGTAGAETGILSSCYATRAYGYNASYATETSVIWSHTSGTLRARDTRFTDVNSWLADVGAQTVCYPLNTPITITLDPVTISTISGQTNNVWADAGDVDVTYAADIKAYIDRLNQPTEDDMIANSLIASGKYFTVNNRLFLSTASIAAGAQIIPGTNCTETSLAAALNALNA